MNYTQKRKNLYESTDAAETPRKPFQLNAQKISAIILGLFTILCLCFLGRIGEDVKTEEIVVNQSPFSGKMEYWVEPGFEWQWFGRTTTYKKTQQLWFGAKNSSGQVEGYPIPVTFNDASEGAIYGSLRVKLPTDPKYLERIQEEYGSMDRLMNDLVLQSVIKVVYSTGPLMSAFESYAERKNDLIEYIKDQLINGVYKTTVQVSEVIDNASGEKKLTKIASLIPDPNAPNGYKRSEISEFGYYGLEVGQVAVSSIEYEDKVTKQIAQQQEANMLIQTSKARAAAAAQEAFRAEEEGKAAAARAKWEQEKIKATEVTKAEQEREVARLAAEKAEFEKKKIIAEGQAQAEANRLKVAAGLTPQERAEWEYKTKVGVAQALADIALPKIVMAGANGSGGSSAMDAMGLKMIVDLQKTLSESK